MKIKNKAYSIHELGKRSNQEDSIWPDVPSASGDMYILCDGMGGHECGEVASQTVCEALSGYIEEHCKPGEYFDQDDFLAALSAAYDALDAKDNPDAVKKMGTTMTFVKFHSGGCFVAHIGDSRVYQVRPSEEGKDKIVFVTKDHSLINDLISLGEMTPEEAKTSNQKNIITRAMQPNQERRAKADFVNLTDIREGDYFYMCSDGMLEVSEDSEIANIFSMKNSDSKKVDIFKGTTAENKDNHSAFIIKVTSVSEDGSDQGGNDEDDMLIKSDAEDRKPVEKRQETPVKKSSSRSFLSFVVALVLVALALFFVRRCYDKEPDASDQAAMEYAAPSGWINVKSTPSGAKIILDGKNTGKTTPSTIKCTTMGRHSVKLDLDGYVTDPQYVDVRNGKKAHCIIVMKEVRQPEKLTGSQAGQAGAAQTEQGGTPQPQDNSVPSSEEASDDAASGQQEPADGQDGNAQPQGENPDKGDLVLNGISI